MNHHNLWPEEFQNKYEELLLTALESPDLFRKEAAKNIDEYNKNAKVVLKSLAHNGGEAEIFLNSWHRQLRTELNKLDSLKTDDKFIQLLRKELLLKKLNSEGKVAIIVDDRKKELVNEFLFNIYPIKPSTKRDKLRKCRENAKLLLEGPESDIIEIYKLHYYAKICRYVSEKNNIYFIDSDFSLIKRRSTNKLIEKQQRWGESYNKYRLEYIKKRLLILSELFDGLFIKLEKYEIDLVSIFDLKHQYNKKIDSLSKNQKNNPLKIKKIFNEVVDDYIDLRIKSYLKGKDVDLELINNIKNELEELISRIFGMDNKNKNLTLLYAKEFREISNEYKAPKDK